MLNATDTQKCEIDVISNEEKQGIQYVVGHIFHKCCKKFRSKKRLGEFSHTRIIIHTKVSQNRRRWHSEVS